MNRIVQAGSGPSRRSFAIALWSGAAAALTGAGLLAWTARSDAVFTDMVSAAISWCM